MSDFLGVTDLIRERCDVTVVHELSKIKGISDALR